MKLFTFQDNVKLIDLTFSEGIERFIKITYSKQKRWQSTKELDTVQEVCISV